MPVGLSTLAPALFALGILGYIRPWLGLTFVVAGSVPYYATLNLLGAATSGPLAGLLFGTVGLVSLLSLAIRRRFTFSHPKVLLLFGFFLLIWYLRWWQDPPVAGASGGSETFGGRAMIYMAVFAAIPFLAGQLVATADDTRQAIEGLAAWGGLAILIVASYWLRGATNFAPLWSGKWEPIRELTGIMLSIDVGIGCLALLGATAARTGWGWGVARLVLIATAIAITVRVGERGPFLFLILAVGIYFLLRTGARRARQLLSSALALAFVAAVAMQTADSYDVERTVGVDSYTPEANENRLTLLSHAIHYASERPFLGWGGSLVGRLTSSGASWMYSHMSMMDPLVETGLLGAVPCWILYATILNAFARHMRRGGQPAQWAARVAPLFSYAFMESQVSGHISQARHMWFMSSIALSLAAGATSEEEEDDPPEPVHAAPRNGKPVAPMPNRGAISRYPFSQPRS